MRLAPSPVPQAALLRAGQAALTGATSLHPQLLLLSVSLQKRVTVPCPRIPPPTASTSLPPAITPTSVSQWPSILGMGPGNSLGTFRASLSHSGRSLLLPQGHTTSTHRPERVRPQSHALRSSMEVPCPGSGGTSHQSSCSQSVCSVCRRARDCQDTLIENSAGTSSHMHPFAGTPQTTLPMPGARQCPRPCLPLHALSKHGVTTQLSCSRGKEKLC